MEKIDVKIGTLVDFEKLARLDFANNVENMFEVVQGNMNLSLREVSLQKPLHNASANYSEEIMEEMIPKLLNANQIPLVGFVNQQPVGYLMANWQQWPGGKIIVIDGILVERNSLGKGLAKSMILELIKLAKANKECRGIHAEMDTTKYQANKLLMNMGFKFAGTKLYVYSSDNPFAGSKEALYFFYAIK